MLPSGYPYGRPAAPPNGRPAAPARGDGPNGRPVAPPHDDSPKGRPVGPPAVGRNGPSGRSVAPPLGDDPTDILPIQDDPTDILPIQDDPTTVDAPLPDIPVQGDPEDGESRDLDAPAETTGTAPARRHRRSAGQSPAERPASTYSEAGSGAETPRAGRRRRPTFWKELPLLIVVALLLTFGIQTFLAKVYVIPSGSMETTLHGCTGCVNDRVIVDKLSYRFADPAPGDVVVFRGPPGWVNEVDIAEPGNPLVRGLQQFGSLVGLAPPDEKDFVKRVIAVGGQTVKCCDPRNRVLVDDTPIEEPYVYYLPEAGPPRQDPFGPFTVAEGQLWMMGDSRNNSADSRVPGQGSISVENVIGQARLIVLPFNRLGGIEAVDPQPVAVGLAQANRDVGTPPVLGLLGTLPRALGRRRAARLEADGFLSPRPHRRG